MRKPPIKAYLNWLRPHAQGGDVDPFGCLPGGDGSPATLSAVKALSLSFGSLAERRAALRYVKTGTRVFDCAALPHVFLSESSVETPRADMTEIMLKWCDEYLGSVDDVPHIPGIALFKWDAFAGCVTRIGYLDIDLTHVFECANISHGLTRVPYKKRTYSHWGLMTKWFTYPALPRIKCHPMYLPDDFTHSTALLQAQLSRMSVYFGRINGIFDDVTRDALKSAQKRAGLVMTGALDEGTLRMLCRMKLNSCDCSLSPTNAQAVVSR